MFKNIPISRILLYFICLGLFPLLIIGMLFMTRNDKLNILENGLEEIQDQFFIKEKKQALNLSVRQHFREADHFYIDKYLETISLLEPEVDLLQRIASDKNFANDERIKKRIDLLTSDSNSINFSEGVVHTFPFFQETTETLTHPIEVNSSDIKKILARIEGVEIGGFSPGPNRPQLLITDFKLDKKKVTDTNEVYTLNMKLIKREYL